MGVCGWVYGGARTRFMKFGCAGVCERTGTVEFCMMPVRYVTQMV